MNCSGFFYNDMIIQCVCIAGDISAAIVPCSRQVVIHPLLPLKVMAAPRLSVTSSMKITRETMTTTAGLQCWSSAYGILHVVITATTIITAMKVSYAPHLSFRRKKRQWCCFNAYSKHFASNEYSWRNYCVSSELHGTCVHVMLFE